MRHPFIKLLRIVYSKKPSGSVRICEFDYIMLIVEIQDKKKCNVLCNTTKKGLYPISSLKHLDKMRHNLYSLYERIYERIPIYVQQALFPSLAALGILGIPVQMPLNT